MLTGEYRFNIDLLTERLNLAVDWAKQQQETRDLDIGLFGASTGAAAALKTAVDRAERVGAVVSRGGRPDLAGNALPQVQAPILLIVGGDDTEVIDLNERAAKSLTAAEHRIEIVPGASHLFEEPGTLEEVARLSSTWFNEKLRAR
jgi:dienelactone hydrolase